MIGQQERIEGQEILDAVANTIGLCEGAKYGLLIRGGRVLCALPENAETARRTLSLYQPQRCVAKAWVILIRLAILVRAHHTLLRRWQVPPGSKGVIKNVGIFVGSTGHLCARAVTVSHGKDCWEVTKFAFGSNGEEILRTEAAMLDMLVDDSRVPRMLDFSAKNEIASLRMAWQDGVSWQTEDPAALLDTLTEWTGHTEPQPLENFPEWRWIEPALSKAGLDHTMMANLAKYRVVPSIRHGDLTRPNLRMGADGRLCVHDWERGAMHGIPGVDLVHFLVQDLFFRQRPTPQQAISVVRARLRERDAATLLASIGWAGNEDALIAMNFALNTGATYIDQSEILSALLNSTDFQIKL